MSFKVKFNCTIALKFVFKTKLLPLSLRRSEILTHEDEYPEKNLSFFLFFFTHTTPMLRIHSPIWCLVSFLLSLCPFSKLEELSVIPADNDDELQSTFFRTQFFLYPVISCDQQQQSFGKKKFWGCQVNRIWPSSRHNSLENTVCKLSFPQKSYPKL